jgi:hypothetical protein
LYIGFQTVRLRLVRGGHHRDSRNFGEAVQVGALSRVEAQRLGDRVEDLHACVQETDRWH